MKTKLFNEVPEISKIEAFSDHLSIEWGSDAQSSFDYLWLRDNCPSAFHPSTRERNFDLLSITDSIRPLSVKAQDGKLEVLWNEHSHRSHFPIEWLKKNDYSRQNIEESIFRSRSWDSGYMNELHRFDAREILENAGTMLDYLLKLQSYGLVLVTDMPEEEGVLEKFTQRINYLRNTNFGVTFEVRSKPNPINQAYTSEKLPLHIDLPYYELPPGYQFLHCILNESEGGESIFADGFKIAQTIQAEHPEDFDLLVNHRIPFRFFDDNTDIKSFKPVIGLHNGQINEINFNAHTAVAFELPQEVMRSYYRAYRLFLGMINDERFIVKFKLKTGQMICFDNRRVMHGRGEFNPQTGKRHLRGCYVDRDELKSRIRVLNQSLQNPNG